MRLRKFDNFARIIQRAMKRFCAVRVYQRQREQGNSLHSWDQLIILSFALNLFSDRYFGWEKGAERAFPRS